MELHKEVKIFNPRSCLKRKKKELSDASNSKNRATLDAEDSQRMNPGFDAGAFHGNIFARGREKGPDTLL